MCRNYKNQTENQAKMIQMLSAVLLYADSMAVIFGSA